MNQTLGLFGEHILLGQYQAREKFTCLQFIAHLFDLIMLELLVKRNTFDLFINSKESCFYSVLH